VGVGDAQNNRATTFVRECRAILHEFLEVETVFRVLKFEVLLLSLGEPINAFIGASPHARQKIWREATTGQVRS
jgi:hypothetical protein